MAVLLLSQESRSPVVLPPGVRGLALTAVTALFFMWGFITVLNDILVPHLKGVFQLNYFQASLIQFTFFGAYFIMSIPAGWIIARFGYRGGILGGLLVCALGTFLFTPAAMLVSYALFLGALFVLASGITILQVAANPYVAVLGPPETSSSRLNLAQAFNSLGTTLAPYLGGQLILAHVASVTSPSAQAASVKLPYLILTGILLVLAAGIACVRLPHLAATEESSAHQGTFLAAFQVPHLVLASVGIFLYVGAEVAIGSYLINFLNDPGVAGIDPKEGARYVSYYWGGAMVGRFIASALTRLVRPNRVLAFNAAVAALLCLVGLFTGGGLAMWSVLAIGLFNSAMFPTIFSLGIDRLGHLTGRGSSLLIMAIVGGAIIPVIMGRTADLLGIHHALFVPALCYLFIIYYGVTGYRRQKLVLSEPLGH